MVWDYGLMERCKLLAIALHTTKTQDEKGAEYRQWVNRKGAPIPYHIHVMRVAKRVASYCNAELKLSTQFEIAIAVAYLHDTVEDVEGFTTKELTSLIGGTIAEDVVEGVVYLTKPTHAFGNRKEREAEICRVLRDAPVWVKLIKACDRIDNLSDHLDGKSHFDFTKSEKYLHESQDLYNALSQYSETDDFAKPLSMALQDLSRIINQLKEANAATTNRK